MAISRDSGALRRRGVLALGALGAALVVAACGGSGTHFADTPRPPATIDLSVYIDNNHVSISPAKVGAGPAILYVTNQASSTVTLALKSSKGAAVASSGSINSGQTAQIQTDLKTGTYELATGTKISAAKLSITKARKNSDSALLEP